MKHKHTLILSGFLLALLITPMHALGQQEAAVSNIALQSVPNAVSISWDAPIGMTVAHYNVYYSDASILENNEQYGDVESTASDIPSFVLMDLVNRGFRTGDTIYVVITAVDDRGRETRKIAEASAETIVPATALQAVHQAAEDGLVLVHAIATSATEVKLEFNKSVQLPDAAHTFFTIVEEETQNPVFIAGAQVTGTTVNLTTLPMKERVKYIVTAKADILDVNGNPLDANQSSASFVGRGVAPPMEVEEEVLPIPDIPTPVIEDVPPIPDIMEQPVTVQVTEPVIMPVAVPEPVPVPVVEEDTTPPEDATLLTLKKILQENGLYTVEVQWKASVNSDDDLAGYNLYESKNRGLNFVGPSALAALSTSAKLTDVPPGTLTVKLTAEDESDNESKGVEAIIVLPETGPVGLVLLSAFGAGAWSVAGRRKKRVK